jgi:hypothetical protein
VFSKGLERTKLFRILETPHPELQRCDLIPR